MLRSGFVVQRFNSGALCMDIEFCGNGWFGGVDVAYGFHER